MRVLITCAGTGGHINPAIAIANILKNKNSQKGESTEILFVGTKNGIENDLVPKAGYEIRSIRTGKLIRAVTLKNVSSMINAAKGIEDAKKILREFKPDAVIGTGGYVCVPVMMAAKSLSTPYVLHESNSYPGISVKLLARNASLVMCGFKEAIAKLGNRKNIVYTGTPCRFSRNSIISLDKEVCKKELGVPNDKKIVFVTFGSQGAKYLNIRIIDMIANRKNKNILYILVTGKKNYNEVVEYIKNIEKEKNVVLSDYLIIKDFVYDMNKMYKVADLCITRAGAMTINEIIVAKKACIYVPYPAAAENHQYYNAKVIGDVGGGIVIVQKDLTEEKLYNNITNIIFNEDVKINMENSLDKLYINNIEESIYSNIVRSISK